MDNPENLKHWQKGLTSAEHLSGDPGVLGSKMKLTFTFGKRKMELIETITKINFPHEFHANYKSASTHNIQQNFFESTEEDYTKWVSKNEFIPLNLVMRILMFIMPSTFKKQTIKYMTDFKNFAENGTSIQNA
ncbi:SRPBCC family protein [Psychroserpens sp.]|nr:SRPBCC family protein [Psychroserpens sp.]